VLSLDCFSLLIIALALSLDAFGVALSIGLNPEIKYKSKLIFSGSFGFFQFLFAFLGSIAGYYFVTYISSLPEVFGGVVIAIVGVIMINDGMEHKEQCILFSRKMYIILGASVSIDALVVGFTALGLIDSISSILMYTIVIGAVTLIMSLLAFVIAKHLKKISIVARYADYIGGIMLVFFGLKMMFLG